MSNFKSGSGNLDFGSDDGDTDESDDDPNPAATETDSEPSPSAADDAPSDTDGSSADQSSSTESTASEASAEQYPYFVRRNNVGDERDTRLELHVRDKVADREAEFRSEIADQLEAPEVSKTDAREFALLAAFERPELVAELMREEGFGALD